MVVNNTRITVQTEVNAPIQTVWKCWTTPEDIMKWNHASEDWHTTRAENDLRPGGKFVSRMEAKDGSSGFDFEGIYQKVIGGQLIEYGLADGRQVSIEFIEKEGRTWIVESFDAEHTHPVEMQRGGWQAILDNFKRYVENQ